MKKLSALLCAAMLLMLCACGTPQDGQSAGTETVPDECRFYYDTPELEVIAPADSTLPLADKASRGAPDYIPVWYKGEYTQINGSQFGEGYTMRDLTDDKATAAGDYGRFCWDGELYHCIHIKADSSFVPNLCSISGGVLWLEISGECRGDDGTAEGAYFSGFDTVIITGSGSLSIDQGIECGTGEMPWPALIIDGPSLSAPSLSLIGNSEPDKTADLIVKSGTVTIDTIMGGNICCAGGTLAAELLVDTQRLVCRGGSTTINGWGFNDDMADAPADVILSGGELIADTWLDERTEYQLWKGSITGPGLANMPTVHKLGDSVTINDTMK